MAHQENPTNEPRPRVERPVVPAETPEMIRPVDTEKILSDANKGRWEKMTDGAKELAGKAYEGVYKTPGVSRVVGKMEIVYSQFWVDRHEEKAVKWKRNMDQSDIQMKSLDSSKRQIEAIVNKLKIAGTPGFDDLSLKLKEIDRKGEKLADKKDKFQNKFEKRENKAILHINERNRIADKLIERYEGKLKPIDDSLEVLGSKRDKINSLLDGTNERQEDMMRELNRIDREKKETEKELREAGMSEKDIRKFGIGKEVEQVMAKMRAEIKKEKDDLEKRKAKLDEEIAKKDAKANKFRHKSKEFADIKAKRILVGINVPKRVKEERAKTPSLDTESHIRKTKRETEENPEEEVVENEEFNGAEEVETEEQIKEKKEKQEMNDMISSVVEDSNDRVKNLKADWDAAVSIETRRPGGNMANVKFALERYRAEQEKNNSLKILLDDDGLAIDTKKQQIISILEKSRVNPTKFAEDRLKKLKVEWDSATDVETRRPGSNIANVKNAMAKFREQENINASLKKEFDAEKKELDRKLEELDSI